MNLIGSDTMTVSEILELTDFNIINAGDLNRNVEKVYIGDLLSWVMSNAEPDNIWLTIMSNINIVAVATLTDVSCIILCEGVVPDNDCLNKAKEHGVTILVTDKSIYDTAVTLSKIL